MRNVLKMLIFFVLYLSAFVTANEYGKRSFTIVLDTTISMREEIDILKSNIESVVKVPLVDIDNYILLPFEDPGKSVRLFRCVRQRMVCLKKCSFFGTYVLSTNK